MGHPGNPRHAQKGSRQPGDPRKNDPPKVKKIPVATRDANHVPIMIGDIVYLDTGWNDRENTYLVRAISSGMLTVSMTRHPKKTWSVDSGGVILLETPSAREILMREEKYTK